jgi:hypothetical protein
LLIADLAGGNLACAALVVDIRRHVGLIDV